MSADGFLVERAVVGSQHTPEQPIRWHEYADIFPWIEGQAFDDLVEDIRKNGVLEPIVFHEGAVLDGRNRYMAARQLGIEYPYVEYEGDDPLGYVISHNLKRRHLTESQRAMVASKLAKEFQKASGSATQVKAAVERWDREEEVKRIYADKSLSYDIRADMVARLRATEARGKRRQFLANLRNVYVARCGDMMKIGVSSFPERRINHLSTANPGIELTAAWPGGFADERKLHDILADDRIEGEWFRYSAHGLDLIENYMRNRQLAETHDAAQTAARIMSVGKRSVERASVLISQGSSELVSAVETGKVSVSAAADIASLPKEEQTEIVAKGEEEIKRAAAKLREQRAEENARKRAEIAAQKAVIPEGKFGTIVIDPPWPMQKIDRDVRPNQVGFDYPTMTEPELVAFGEKVNACAADNCHMFMWTTQKFLPVALRVLDAWDFRYVLTMVWHKSGGFQPIGLPQYNCEFAIYARKGAPVFIDTKAFNCCFDAPRREHSRKPDEFYDLVRRVTGEGRIDIFSREPRDGFAQLGNEADKFGEAA